MRFENNKTGKSLRFSVVEGTFAAIMTGFTQDYFTPFLLVLKGTVGQVAALSALPNLFASLAQLATPEITEKIGARKKTVVMCVFLQAVSLVPMVFMAVNGHTNPRLFILNAVIFTVCGAMSLPAWGSMMSDIVPAEKRGSFFGWRTKTLGLIIAGSAFAAGVTLNSAKRFDIFTGFTFIFASAFVSRLFSMFFIRKIEEPRLVLKKEHYFTLFDFLSKLKTSNFAKFVMFVSLMTFTVNLASPFFAVLMLKTLNFSYFVYSVVTITATFTMYLMMQRWGGLADRIGNLRVIKFTSPLIALIPVLWLINRHPLFLCAAQVYSGLLWAGFNLCASNFIYDAVTPEKRTRCISYFNVFNGLALCAGALTGGLLLKWLPPLYGSAFLMLFFISAVARMAVAVTLPLYLKEVRTVQEISNNDLFFSVLGTKPVLGIDRKQ